MSNAGTQTIKVSRAFSSNMVLQRNAPIKVWGTADEGITSVSGEFMGESACARVDESGEWTLEFSARDTVNSSQILKICADGLDPVVFDNVLIGDVYFITGQSNAEMAIGSCINAYPEERSDLYRENVRLFTQSIPYIIERKELWPVPQKDVVNPEWHWKKAVDDAAIYEFSAIGYFFGRVIADKLPELPIGLIMGAAGGSQIIELMSGETSKRLGYSQSATVGASGYYNNLINPFIRMPIRAMIYYQGESECWPTATPDYGRNLDELVKDLRNVWGIPFKFYNVQLSSHGEESKTSWPTIGEIRAVQYDGLLYRAFI